MFAFGLFGFIFLSRSLGCKVKVMNTTSTSPLARSCSFTYLFLQIDQSLTWLKWLTYPSPLLVINSVVVHSPKLFSGLRLIWSKTPKKSWGESMWSSHDLCLESLSFVRTLRPIRVSVANFFTLPVCNHCWQIYIQMQFHQENNAWYTVFQLEMQFIKNNSTTLPLRDKTKPPSPVLQPSCW